MSNDTFVIQGLAGARTLRGEVRINGAKNAVLKAMPAALLFADTVIVENVPDTEDVGKMSDLLIGMGVKITSSIKERKLTIDSSGLTSTDFDHEISKSMRSSVVATGPILARYKKVSFPAPGGCVIGERPIDRFIEGYTKMGATVEIKTDLAGNSRYIITAPKTGLTGAEIIFPFQTVGGTETLMMAAVLANGKTVLKNCAMEPEIGHLAEFLNDCGAKIKGIGTTTIEIHGSGNDKGEPELLHAKGKSYVTIADRIETGSFLLLGLLSSNDLKITHCDPSLLEIPITMLRESISGSGISIETGANFIHVKYDTKAHDAKTKDDAIKLKPFNIRTHEYPGFPTDLQAPATVYLTQATGDSIILETIFDSRFKYTEDLKNMGANITVMNPREILIKGQSPLKTPDEETLEAYDIRAGFAIVMAALLAKGRSVIKKVYYIDRGYEHLETRLKAIGADIQRISGEVEL